MRDPLHVLLIEDSSTDALLLQRELARSGLDPRIQRVESQEEMIRALGIDGWDVVISDYLIPNFSGLQALDILRQSGRDVPFIMISGKMGEEVAVQAMRAGAQDFVTKDNLARLSPAVKREIKEARLRREHHLTQKILERTQQEMERQRARDREMKLLGQLVSGVAHEVRNPLNAIMALLEALFMELGPQPACEPYMKHIRTQINRLTNLMQDLLELGKPVSSEDAEEISLRELCAMTTELWNKSGTEPARTVRFVDAGEGEIRIQGDFPRLQQVIMNLLENASHHSSPESAIALRLRRHDCGFAAIEVIDGGSGVPTQNLERIFDPFFTTRKAGTGLGLGIARHIVESHGGRLSVYNNDPPPGATAEIRLPVVGVRETAP